MSVAIPVRPAAAVLRLPRAWAVAMCAFAVSRAVALVSGGLAHATWGDDPRRAVFDPGGLTRPFGSLGDALVAPFAAWDTVWYLVIANDAYGGAGPREAFFPLFPLLVDLAGVVVGPPVLAAVAVGSIAGVVALAVVHRLADVELGSRAADLAVWALALFPVSFFLSAGYSESLFLALSAGAVLAARSDRWLVAGVLAALASSTRSAGVVLVVGLALLWWAGARRPRDLLAIGAAPLGLVAFCAGLALAGESPTAPFGAQGYWLRSFAGPFVGTWHGLRAGVAGTTHDAWLLASLLVALPALAGAWRRLPPAYGAYAVAALALPLSWPAAGQPLMSLPRFLLVLPPLFLWAGWWLARGGVARRALVLGTSAGGLAACSAMFATWQWVA